MEKTIHILLVEDEAITSMLMQMELKRIGYSALQYVSTGEKAITLVKQDPPDIILMDIGLAGDIDGIETAVAIKAIADIPIVMITGYEDNETRKRAERIRPLGFLVKPIEIHTIKVILDDLFA